MSIFSLGNHLFKVFRGLMTLNVLAVLMAGVLLSCGGSEAVEEDVLEYDGPLKGVKFAVMGNSISSYKGTQPQGYYYNYTPDTVR